METDEKIPATFGLEIEVEDSPHHKQPKSLKGLGYLWPKIPPATARKIRALAKQAGMDTRHGSHVIANRLINFALQHTTIKK